MEDPKQAAVEAVIEEVGRRVDGFAGAMRAAGIHLGINGFCPVDGEAWPCSTEQEKAR